MIGKGAKYLTAAGFGRYSITAASLGSNLVFGSLWLNYAAQQAIMDAFGVDGTAVIRATNKYLNGIAASDMAKATALAGFINEDPMMVCSLGLEPQGVTMPVRGLKGDGVAYLKIGYVANNSTGFEISFIDKEGAGTSSNYSVKFGAIDNMTRYGISNYPTYTDGYFINSQNRYPSGLAFGELNRMKFSGTIYEANGTQQTVSATSISSITAEIHIFGWADTGRFYTPATKDIFEFFKMFDNNGEQRELYPWKLKEAKAAADCYPQVACAAGTCGMIDLVTGKFYHNANASGSFGIDFALPDGTPWTPPTPEAC